MFQDFPKGSQFVKAYLISSMNGNIASGSGVFWKIIDTYFNFHIKERRYFLGFSNHCVVSEFTFLERSWGSSEPGFPLEINASIMFQAFAARHKEVSRLLFLKKLVTKGKIPQLSFMPDVVHFKENVFFWPWLLFLRRWRRTYSVYCIHVARASGYHV